MHCIYRMGTFEKGGGGGKGGGLRVGNDYINGIGGGGRREGHEKKEDLL